MYSCMYNLTHNMAQVGSVDEVESVALTIYMPKFTPFEDANIITNTW